MSDFFCTWPTRLHSTMGAEGSLKFSVPLPVSLPVPFLVTTPFFICRVQFLANHRSTCRIFLCDVQCRGLDVFCFVVFSFFFFFVVPTGRVWLLTSFWQSIQIELLIVINVEIEPRVPLLVHVVQDVIHLSSPLFCPLP